MDLDQIINENPPPKKAEPAETEMQQATSSSLSNIINMFPPGAGATQARARVQGAIDSNPEQAAKSISIGAQAKIPPQVVDSDFKVQSGIHQANQNTAIINSNPKLQNYINSDPMAAKVSKNDIPQLHKISGMLSNYSAGSAINHMLIEAMKGFQTGVGEGKIGSWAPDWTSPELSAMGGVGWATLTGITDPIEAGLRLMSGVTMAGASAVGDIISQATGSERANEDVKAIGEAVQDPAFWMSMGPVGETLGLPFEVAGHNARLRSAAMKASLDKVRADVAKEDQKALGEIIKASQESETRELSPELFAEKFVAQHYYDNLGISSDAVRELYGDKVPSPDDGLLGWIPDLSQQLSSTAQTGGDIEVPFPLWVAKVEPEVWNKVKDNARFREGGLTVEEGKNLPKGIEAYHGSPYEFEAFDTGQIGTGEGAQSYGYGHYVAENPEVAQSYVPDVRGTVTGAQLEKGNLYRVHILRSPEEFLDWDVPFNEQPQVVKDTFNKWAEDHGIEKPTEFEWKGALQDPRFTKKLNEAGIAGIKFLDQFSRAKDQTADVARANRDLTKQIEGIQKELEENKDNPNLLPAFFEQRQADIAQLQAKIEQNNELLKKPGPEPTHNYVVFNDKDLEVQTRNGEAVRAVRKESGLEAKPAGAAATPQEAIPREPVPKPVGKVVPDITKARYEKLRRLIQAQQQSDREYAARKVYEEEKKKQTQDWKDKEIKVRQEVVDSIDDNPNFAADSLFREGKIGDQTIPKPRLRIDSLTPEELAAVPKKYVAKEGLTPDEAASLTGFDTGKELLLSLNTWEADRGTTQPIVYRRQKINDEVKRVMQERYGDLQANIIKAAQEHVLAQPTIDRLEEEALIDAVDNGMTYEDAKKTLGFARQKALEDFLDVPQRTVKVIKYLRNVGRLDREVEQAFLSKDYAKALTFRERKYITAVLGQRALEVEKMRSDVSKFQKRYGKRSLPRVSRDVTNYVRKLLSDAGIPLKVLPQEIDKAIEYEGYGSFEDFVTSKQSMGWDPTVSAQLIFEKPKLYDSMTVGDLETFHKAVDSLDYIGRKEQTMVLRGNAEDFDKWIERVATHLKKRPVRSAEEMAKGGKWAWRIDAPLTRIEEFAKDVDYREELGPFYDALIVPYEISKANSFKRLKDLSQKFRAIKTKLGAKWYKTLGEDIPNDFVHDPYYDQSFKLTRWNMIKMMLNLGNKGNEAKLIEGITLAREGELTEEGLALTRDRLQSLLDKHATHDDWKFVQHMWDIADSYKDDIYKLNYTTGAKEAKFVEAREVPTKFGTFRGGYFPLIPDKLRSTIRERKAPKIDGPLGPDYYRANTSQGHLIERTKARYFVDITNGPEQLVGRMQQVIHDLAYREFAIDAGKVIYNPKVKGLLRKYYGIEYEQLLEPWLKRVVSTANVPERELEGWNSVLRHFRLNMIAHALPLNYAVEFSPSVGTLNLKKLIQFNTARALNKEMVMRHSRELEHTMYSIDRDVREALNKVTVGRNWTQFQVSAMEKLFSPMVWLEQQFRMATFYGEFMKQKGRGLSDSDAGILADSLIRERHGVSAVGDLPMMMSNPNEFVKMSTVFMGYFTAQRNWMRQIPHYWRVRDFKQVAKLMWGTVAINTLVNAALFERRRKDDNFFTYMGRAMLSYPLGMIPFVREGYNYFAEGYKPTSPVLSAISALYQLIVTDPKKILEGKRLKHPIKDITAGAGLIAGVPGTLQAGRTGQFLYDVNANRQHPRDLYEWIRGIFTGYARLGK